MRVLIVEDETLVLMELVGIVGRLGHNVVTAKTARDAHALLSCAFDVALLDIVLPDEDVFPFALELQARGIPFGFITALGTKAIVESGFAHCLHTTKPPDEARIAEMLDRLVQS